MLLSSDLEIIVPPEALMCSGHLKSLPAPGINNILFCDKCCLFYTHVCLLTNYEFLHTVELIMFESYMNAVLLVDCFCCMCVCFRKNTLRKEKGHGASRFPGHNSSLGMLFPHCREWRQLLAFFLSEGNSGPAAVAVTRPPPPPPAPAQRRTHLFSRRIILRFYWLFPERERALTQNDPG